MSRLANKVALVVGGGSGIGAAIAERFAAEGANVYATSRGASTGSTAPAHGEGIVHAVRADAGKVSDLEKVLTTVHTEAGRIDVLIANAGMADFATLGEITEDHFDRIFALNVRSLLFAVQAAAAHMSSGGSIVLVGSIADEIGTRGYGVYGATKAAVRSLARTWANELAPRGIRVNVVRPGPTDTAMFAQASDEMRHALASRIPLGRLGVAEDVASAALFLASDESSYVTGADIPVDGGMTQV
jgi:NAD(P)-dependent dehydrogenase (short-subunit alcohol dehydrogenase family)